MIYVLLQQPGNGYIWLVKATSEKHWDLVDRGFTEVASGSYIDMQEKLLWYHSIEREELIHLINWETHSLIQTTEEGLTRMLDIDRNYLKDKEFL